MMHLPLSKHTSGHRAYLKKRRGLFVAMTVLLVLVGAFFITRGATPQDSELAYIEHSSLGQDAGSVVPASCDSNNPLAPTYIDPTTGTKQNSGSHFLNDCTAKCPDGTVYDPYFNPGACVKACAANTGQTCYLTNSCGQKSAPGVIGCDGTCGNKYETTKLTPSGHYLGTFDDFRNGPADVCSQLAKKTMVTGNSYVCAPNLNTQGCTATDKSGGCAAYGVTKYYAESRTNGNWGSYNLGQNWCQDTGVEWVQCGPTITAPPDSNCPSNQTPPTTTTTVTPTTPSTAVNGACDNSATVFCTAGTYKAVSGTTWQCVGSNGGTTASCTLSSPTTTCTPPQTLVNGVCTSPATPTSCTNGATNPPDCTLGTSVAPTVPTLSALWQNTTYLGPTGSAFYPAGYSVLAQATSPINANLEYYFEWSSDSAAAQWSPWVSSGSWGGVNHYANYPTGSYYVRAWAYDQYGNWSASPTAWYLITLTTPPLSVSCSGTPGNPYVGQPVTWNSVVSGGSGGAISYSWSGTDGLSGATASVQKTYTTAGQKNATVTVIDTQSGDSASASCTSGTLQPDGPTSGGTTSGSGGPGSGVGVGSCTAAISANPNVVEQGQNTTISWSVAGGSLCANSCSGTGFSTGGAISGTAVATTKPTPPTTTYTLTCSGGTYGPPAAANATVTVLSPTVTITANGQSGSTRVNPNTPNNVSVSWSSEHATSCDLTKNGSAWLSGVGASGTHTDSANVQTTYTADCQNDYGAHATASVVVNMLPVFQNF